MSDLWRESDEPELPPGEASTALVELAALIARPERGEGWYTIEEIAAEAGVGRDQAYYRLKRRKDVESRRVFMDGKWKIVYRVKHE